MPHFSVTDAPRPDCGFGNGNNCLLRRHEYGPQNDSGIQASAPARAHTAARTAAVSASVARASTPTTALFDSAGPPPAETGIERRSREYRLRPNLPIHLIRDALVIQIRIQASAQRMIVLHIQRIT